VTHALRALALSTLNDVSYLAGNAKRTVAAVVCYIQPQLNSRYVKPVLAHQSPSFIYTIHMCASYAQPFHTAVK
jgi:hypothetical protein